MESDSMVGVLAMFTLLAGVVVVGFFYLRSLKNPKNMQAAKNVAGNDSSAHTAVRGGNSPDRTS